MNCGNYEQEIVGLFDGPDISDTKKLVYNNGVHSIQ